MTIDEATFQEQERAKTEEALTLAIQALREITKAGGCLPEPRSPRKLPAAIERLRQNLKPCVASSARGAIHRGSE
ncbi:MAG TPA: hypothetical protein VKY85_02830 [Candidatus Angelobacter sp.]|nr:hypothetical protein [Candidatus Angelobacter sp.]